MSFFVKIITRRSPEGLDAEDTVEALPEVFATYQEASEHAEECFRSGLYPADSYTYEVTDGRGDRVSKPGS